MQDPLSIFANFILYNFYKHLIFKVIKTTLNAFCFFYLTVTVTKCVEN